MNTQIESLTDNEDLMYATDQEYDSSEVKHPGYIPVRFD